MSTITQITKLEPNTVDLMLDLIREEIKHMRDSKPLEDEEHRTLVRLILLEKQIEGNNVWVDSA